MLAPMAGALADVLDELDGFATFWRRDASGLLSTSAAGKLTETLNSVSPDTSRFEVGAYEIQPACLSLGIALIAQEDDEHHSSSNTAPFNTTKCT